MERPLISADHRVPLKCCRDTGDLGRVGALSQYGYLCVAGTAIGEAVRTCKAPALTTVSAGALRSVSSDYGVCEIRLTARFDTTKFALAASTVSTWL